MSLIWRSSNIYSPYPCQAYGCRYSSEHLTKSHKCGSCGKLGHGVHECGNLNRIENIKAHSSFGSMYERNVNALKVPDSKSCRHPKCQERYSHSTLSHQPEFEISETEKYFDFMEKNANSLLTNKPNHYCIHDAGMGYWQVFKNTNGKIEHKLIDYEDKKSILNYVGNMQEIKVKF